MYQDFVFPTGVLFRKIMEIKSKVFDVLRALSKDELKKFGEYLTSPVFNKRKIIYELFESYKKFHPSFEDKNLTKERIFSRLFPDRKFNDENFRNLNSILLKHAEDFLAFVNYSTDELSIKKHLLNEINHRKILALFEKHFEEGMNISSSSGMKDASDFFSLHELLMKKDLYNSIINKFSKDDITKSEINLLVYFIISFLEIQKYILYHCRIYGLDNSLYISNSLAESIMKNIPDEIKMMPQIQIHYNGLKLEQSNDKKYYEKLKSLIGKFGHEMEEEKHYNIYQTMMDYIKRTGSSSDLKTAKELFLLRREIIEKGLMMENTIKQMFFLNLVKSGLRSGEFDWIYNFINEYQNMLIPKHREITTELSLALYYFEKKEFNKSLSHAARVRYEDSFFNLEVKTLTSKIFFETEEYENLINSIASYRMYISKNRALGKNEIDSHSRFLNFFDKLIRIKEQKKFYKLIPLIEEVHKKDFNNNSWILEKANEMLSKDRLKMKS